MKPSSTTKCSVCHTETRPTDFFCFNCGANLKPAPLSFGVIKQIGIYLGSFFLPPLGIIWGIKYLREGNQKAKIVGVVAIALTVISLIVTVLAFKSIADAVNQQINTQLPGMIGF